MTKELVATIRSLFPQRQDNMTIAKDLVAIVIEQIKKDIQAKKISDPRLLFMFGE
jgi:hypothetical protein